MIEMRTLVDRPSPLRFRWCIRVFVLALTVSLIPGRIHAQINPPSDHPLFAAPVQEAEGSPVDLQHVRLHVALDPVEHEIAASLFAHLTVVDTTASSIRYRIRGISVEAVRVVESDSLGERNVAWEVRNDTLHIPISDRTSQELGLIVEYRVASGIHTLPLGSENGPWTQIWTSFHQGGPSWIALPGMLDDRFSTELRVTAPSAWRLFLPGNEQFAVEELDGRTVETWLGSDAGITKLGFVAINRTMLLPDAGDHIVSVLGLDERSIDEARISIPRMARFFSERTAGSAPDSTLFVLLPTPSRSMASGAGVTILAENALPEGLDAVEEDFRLATALAQTWVETHIPLLQWMDVWVQEALSSYMAALYVNERHGEVAYRRVLWSCRERYLAETQTYLRPLVWDRWDESTDLLDDHASCKGAWIFHMITWPSGVSAFWEALSSLAGTGPVSSEEVRVALERFMHRDLSDYFDQWIYAAGHPILTYSFDISPDQQSFRIQIQQTQEGYLIPAAFRLDVPLESASLSGVARATVQVTEMASSAVVPVELRPQYVRLDPDGDVLFQFEEAPDAAVLISSLRRQETDAGRFVASRLLREADVDASMLIGIRPVLFNTASPWVQQELLGIIARLAPSTSAVRDILTIAADTSSRSQAAAISLLGRFTGDADARRTALNAANSSSNPLILSASVEALVRLDSDLAWRVLQSATVTESTGNIVRRTAARLIPQAPVGEDQKIDALLTLFETHADNRLRRDVVLALSNYSSERRIRAAVLPIWPSSSSSMRSAILDVILAESPSRQERVELTAWLRSEPVASLRRRLLLYLNTGNL